MSILFMDSFDMGDTVYKYADDRLPTPNVAYGLHGKGVYLGDDAGDQLALSIGNTDSTVLLSCNLHLPATGQGPSARIIEAFQSSDLHFMLYYDLATEELSLRHADSTVWGSTSFPLDEWHHVQCKVLVDDTVGTYELRVDGVSQFSGTATDTKGDGAAYVDNFAFAGTGASDIDRMWVDDIVVQNGTSPNGDFLGVTEVVPLLPDGNGNSSGMLGSDGNSVDNYALVNEDPVATASYVGAATEGTKDTYSVDNLPSSDVTVFGLRSQLIAAKSDATSKFVRPVVRSGGTDYPGASVPLPESFAGVYEVWETDPDTSSEWTPAAVNAVEVGQEARDS